MRRITLLFTLAIGLVFAQDAELAGKLDHVMSAYQKNRGFMGSALVAKGGKVVMEKGYGMANVELDVPNTPDTKFRLGSITKQFTATAIMQLQEQGKLSTNDLACKFLPSCPDAWKTITVHHLLTHTSGIPSYTGGEFMRKPGMVRSPLSPVEIVMLSKDKALEFEPGTKWNYDNTGYVFLGAIIEKVSGEKYADYLKKHVFGPLDMQNSGYDDTTTLLKNRAAGYQPGPGGMVNSDYIDMSLPHAAGSLYSTVRDLYRWDRAMYTEKVLSKASWGTMFTPVQRDYGYGLMLAPMANHKQIGHGGGIFGFTTYTARFPDDDAFVVVLSNFTNGNMQNIARDLAGTMFGEKVELPGEKKAIAVDSKILERYAGTYQAAPGTISVTNESGHLMVQPKGQEKLEAFASTETEFFLKAQDVSFTFVLGEDGKAKEFQLKQGGRTMVAKRVN
jgi:CubicO group peptidase (beta-lactamase class C family)